jgi:hypothetical protein
VTISESCASGKVATGWGFTQTAVDTTGYAVPISAQLIKTGAKFDTWQVQFIVLGDADPTHKAEVTLSVACAG